MNKFWTAEELQYLQDNYYHLGPKACATHLNRTSMSVSKKAARLGLSTSLGKLRTHEEYENSLFEKEIDYIPLEPYINTYTPILHECFNGHIRKISPSNALKSQGCPICNNIVLKTTEQYKIEIEEKDIWPIEEYINTRTPIMHECIKGHKFRTSPTSLLKNLGCPSCATHGFNQNKPGILYYLKITKNNQTYYKLGITNRTVAERFERDKDKQISIIHQIYYNKGLDAKEHEQKLLFKFKHKRVFVPGFLKSGGNSELFEYDIQPFQ